MPKRGAGPQDKCEIGSKGVATVEDIAEEPFPPLSTSLEVFLDGNTDRPFRELIYNVLTVSTLMLRSRERFAAQMGVTAPQYSMMVVIGEAKEATVGQIASQLHVSSPFVTAEVRKLAKMGVVEKRPNEQDRRSSFLRLTAKGMDLIREIGPIRRLANDMIFGSLTNDQARQFTEIIGILLIDAERALHELDSRVLLEKCSHHRGKNVAAAPALPKKTDRVGATRKLRKTA